MIPKENQERKKVSKHEQMKERFESHTFGPLSHLIKAVIPNRRITQLNLLQCFHIAVLGLLIITCSKVIITFMKVL